VFTLIGTFGMLGLAVKVALQGLHSFRKKSPLDEKAAV